LKGNIMKKNVPAWLFLVVAVGVWYFVPLFAAVVMEALLVVLIVLAVAAVVLVPLTAATVWFGFPWLAEENILFTTVKGSTAKAIMRGKSFERFTMSFPGYHLNDPKKPGYKPLIIKKTKDSDGKNVETREGFPDWEVVYHGKGNKNGFEEKNKDGENEQDDEYHEHRNPILKYLLKHLGLYWVGWPWRNSVYVYQFQWNVTVTNKAGNEEMLPRAEPADFIYVNDVTYAVKTEGAETKDRLSTDELTLVTVAVRNPYRALFIGEDWMRRMTAAVNRHVRNFVSSKDYDELINILKKDEAGAGKEVAEKWALEFSQPIIDLGGKLSGETDKSPEPRGLRGKYGIDIRAADLQTVELSGLPEAKKKLQEAAMRVYSATQDAKATLLDGQAKADVVGMMGEKEAEALRTRLAVITKHGATGELLAQLDAMRDAGGAGARIIWANNPFIPKGGEK
jgi:hypothetical protein